MSEHFIHATLVKEFVSGEIESEGVSVSLDNGRVQQPLMQQSPADDNSISRLYLWVRGDEGVQYPVSPGYQGINSEILLNRLRRVCRYEVVGGKRPVNLNGGSLQSGHSGEKGTIGEDICYVSDIQLRSMKNRVVIPVGGAPINCDLINERVSLKEKMVERASYCAISSALGSALEHVDIVDPESILESLSFGQNLFGVRIKKELNGLTLQSVAKRVEADRQLMLNAMREFTVDIHRVISGMPKPKVLVVVSGGVAEYVNPCNGADVAVYDFDLHSSDTQSVIPDRFLKIASGVGIEFTGQPVKPKKSFIKVGA